MKKDDIDKIDEQIQSILDVEKSISERNDNSEGHVVYVDTIDAPKGDTKRLNKIDDLEEVVNEKEEDTKKIGTVEEITVPPVESNNVVVEPQVLPENNDSPKKKSKKKVILILCICFFVLILLIVLVFVTGVFTKKEEVSLKEVEKKRILNNYGDAVHGVISLYYDKKELLLEYEEAIQLVHFDYDVLCDIHEVYEDGSLYLTKCSIDGEDIKYSYGKKQKKKEVIIPEGAVKVYVPKNGGSATFEEPSDISNYDVYGVVIDGAYSDLAFLDAISSEYVVYTTDNPEGNFIGHMVNYKTGKVALEHVSYYSILPIKVGDHFDYNYAAVGTSEKNSYGNHYWGIYNLTTGNPSIVPRYSSVGSPLKMGITGGYSYVYALAQDKVAVSSYDTGYSSYGVINYTNGIPVIPEDYSLMLSSGDYIWARDYDGVGYVFDYFGKKYLRQYDKIYWLVDGKYALVQDKANIKVVSARGDVLYNFGKYSFKQANYGLTYDDGAIFQFTNSHDGDYDYDYGDSCIEFIYHGNSRKGEVKNGYCGGIAKPILYLYPEEKTHVSVSFEHPEYLDTTYPKFTGKWEVTVKPNGDMHDKDGKYYYALYWDEHRIHSVDFQEGFYVEGKDAIAFLEEKLDVIGLSLREKNEFIMYWLPILEKNGKNLVYFELTEERENYHKILINPKPDSLLRLVIHIKKVNKKGKVPAQKLVPFERNGFVAVEWGGMVY